VRSLPLVGPTYPSASALSLAAICVAPWSLGLPRDDDGGADAERGQRLHAATETLARGDVRYEHFSAADERALEHVLAMLDEDHAAAIETQWPDGRRVRLRAEVGVQWRLLDLGDEAQLVDRQPGEEAVGWFSGTADLAYMRQDGVLLVADWKFGPRQRYVAERARDHWQGWSLALFLCTALCIAAARPGDVVARFEARYVDEEGVLVDGIDITQAQLDAHAVELGRLAARIEAGDGPRVGAACGSCKARAACPAMAGVVAEAVTRLGAALPPSLLRDVPANHEQAAAAWAVVEAIEGAVPVMRRSLEAYARVAGPVPLGMGRALEAKVSKVRETALDTPEAIAAAAEVLGVEAGAFTRPTTTKGDLLRAWSARTGKGTTSADGRRVAKLLRKRGVLVEGAPSVTLRVVRPEDSEEE
jgi:hypothetical protein